MPATFTVEGNEQQRRHIMRTITQAAIADLDLGLTPEFHETTCKPTDPTPIFDRLTSETFLADHGFPVVIDLFRKATRR